VLQIVAAPIIFCSADISGIAALFKQTFESAYSGTDTVTPWSVKNRLLLGWGQILTCGAVCPSLTQWQMDANRSDAFAFPAAKLRTASSKKQRAMTERSGLSMDLPHAAFTDSVTGGPWADVLAQTDVGCCCAVVRQVLSFWLACSYPLKSVLASPFRFMHNAASHCPRTITKVILKTTEA